MKNVLCSRNMAVSSDVRPVPVLRDAKLWRSWHATGQGSFNRVGPLKTHGILGSMGHGTKVILTSVPFSRGATRCRANTVSELEACFLAGASRGTVPAPCCGQSVMFIPVSSVEVRVFKHSVSLSTLGSRSFYHDLVLQLLFGAVVLAQEKKQVGDSET